MARQKRNQVQQPPQMTASRGHTEKFVATFNKAIAAHQQGRLEDAAIAFREAVALNPTEAITYNNLGAVLKTLGRPAEAVEVLKKSIELDPKAAMTYSNLGSAYTSAKRFEEALAPLRQALVLQADYPEAMNNMCSVLLELAQLDEAETMVRKAIALKPDYAEAHSNLGAVLSATGRTKEAIAAFSACIALSPNIPMPHKNLGLAQLRNGDYDIGWKNYEWRWKADGLPPRDYAHPLWQGGPVQGKTVLLYAEQGLGDAIQFARFVPVLVAMGARVVLEVHEPLIPVMRTVTGVSEVIPLGGIVPHIDTFQAIMSVPGVLGVRPDNVPCPMPYLSAEPARVAKWRERLGTHGFKVGIVWEGKGETPSQRSRSAPLEKFASLAAIPGVRLISLQKGGDVSGVSFPVEDLGPDFDTGAGAFLDSAAVLMNLDLMISIDTSIAHLAGALDVPTWIPLKRAPDWRFGDHGTDWPWYPNAKLFRQPAVGAWDEPFADLTTALRQAVAAGGVPKVASKPLVVPTPAAAAPISPPARGRDFSRIDRFLDSLVSDVYPEEPSELHTSITASTIETLHKDGFLKAGQRVLDIGCGQGLALEMFDKIGLKATGLTLGSDAAVCRGKGFDVLEMDQNFMDFPDASFDVLWCRHVLEHSVMPLFTLSEYKRVCKPGGVIYVEVPAPETAARHEFGKNHYSVFPNSSWVSQFEKVGLIVERSWVVGFTLSIGEDKYWSYILRRPA